MAEVKEEGGDLMLLEPVHYKRRASSHLLENISKVSTRFDRMTLLNSFALNLVDRRTIENC